MSQYRVSWAMQGQAAGSIGAAIATMDAELAAVNSQVNSLISTWESDAQVAYLARQQQWNSAADNIKAALMQFQRGMATAAEISSGAERTNVGVVTG